MNKELYTKIFLKQADISINEATVKDYLHRLWKNTRNKESGGLRLTEDGYDFLVEKLDLKIYDVPYPKDMEFTTNVIIWLDQFIDCPYYLGPRSICVTNEKKALELSLFSGDVRKFGLTKAISRQKNAEKG